MFNLIGAKMQGVYNKISSLIIIFIAVLLKKTAIKYFGKCKLLSTQVNQF
jgi:hypothetical protein